jgi:NDP-sugar pyrophosphorylase family protein
MRALILAGGKGTRLRPLTVYTPKPIVPILNRPFLTYQIDLLRKAGITDITLSLSYQPDKIEDVLGDGSEFGVKLRFVTEPSALGTAGAVRYAIEMASETVLVLNGDILTDLDLSKVLRAHAERDAQITIALARVEDPTKYGLVAMDPNGSIESFVEKPKDGTYEGSTNTINAGIYILEPAALGLIPKGVNSSFEYDVFPIALEKGFAFSGYVLEDNYWQDIGTPQSYLAAHLDILSGKAAFALGDRIDSTETSPTAFIENSIIGEGCVIKPNAKIANSVLGPGVHVEEKAVIENSVLWAHSRVSTFSKIRGSVLAKGCHVGKDAELRAGTVLGDKAMIPDYSVV